MGWVWRLHCSFEGDPRIASQEDRLPVARHGPRTGLFLEQRTKENRKACVASVASEVGGRIVPNYVAGRRARADMAGKPPRWVSLIVNIHRCQICYP